MAAKPPLSTSTNTHKKHVADRASSSHPHPFPFRTHATPRSLAPTIHQLPEPTPPSFSSPLTHPAPLLMSERRRGQKEEGGAPWPRWPTCTVPPFSSPPWVSGRPSRLQALQTPLRFTNLLLSFPDSFLVSSPGTTPPQSHHPNHCLANLSQLVGLQRRRRRRRRVFSRHRPIRALPRALSRRPSHMYCWPAARFCGSAPKCCSRPPPLSVSSIRPRPPFLCRHPHAPSPWVVVSRRAPAVFTHPTPVSCVLSHSHFD